MSRAVHATSVNWQGKVEKNAKVKAGECIFPFKHKYESHDACIATNKGEICATEVNPKTRTLTKYGYCPQGSRTSPRSRTSPSKTSPKKGTQKKALSPHKHSKKLNAKSPRSSRSKSRTPKSRTPKSRSNSSKNRSHKAKTLSKKHSVRKMETRKVSRGPSAKRYKLTIVPSLDLKPTEEKQQMPQQDKEQEKPAKAYNEEFIEVLGELAGILQRQGEPFKARAYQRGQETIMTHEGDITKPEQLKGLPGVGDAIYKKLKEYMETGKIAVLERERNNPINVLTNIYGVGPKKAQELINAGFDTIEKIQALSPEEVNKMFNANQKKGLEYYDDINQKIPRAEIVEYDKMFASVIDECCGTATKYEVVGSYRRGKQTSGDIDVIITNQDDDKRVFAKFLDALKEQGILEYTFSKGPTKSLTMCRLTPSSPVARRVDFLYTSPAEYPFAILYFTGSKIFNTVMRQRALKMGYTLNEHGISHMKSGVKGAKVTHEFKTERDIFDFLGMEYKAPNERTDGRAVQDKKEGRADAEEGAEAPIPTETITTVFVAPENTKDAVEPPKKKARVRVPKKATLKKQMLKSAEMAEQFKTEGASYLNGLTEDQLLDLIQDANDAYYNKKPFLSDEEFDIVKEYAERKYPDNQGLKAIGAPVEKGKVKLPFNMPSMNKIKPDTDSLAKWMAKYQGPYVISAKLDGVSGMYVMEGGKKAPKLYTRGDGTHGQDVSHLIPYLRLPSKGAEGQPADSHLVIRGEFIIAKQLFAEKYAAEFSNPRNFIAGVINSKTKLPERYRDMDFVAYEVIKPELAPEQQFALLDQLNVDVVYNQTISRSELSNELLSDELVKLRDSYKYEIDGVIVADNAMYKRTPENPEHAFAFKMVLSDQVAEVKVLDVLWSPSKDGYLKPRVQVEPVVLGGARIEYATGFNAKFIEDNKIGVGAVIQLVRSGDVIPHILSVVKPAEKAMMPSVPWKWNATHVDAVLEDKTHDETVVIKTITLFFKHLDTVGMGPGNVTKLVTSGLNTIPAIIHATEQELQKVLGKKTGQMAFSNIRDSIAKATLPQLMTATNIFGRGFGDKRFVSIIATIPDIVSNAAYGSVGTRDALIARISGIKGLSKASATEFVDRLGEFRQFIQDAGLETKVSQGEAAAKARAKPNSAEAGHPLFGKKVVMSGFRDKELAAEIESKGAEMSSGVSKNTFVVIVKNKDEDTGKIDKAKELGVTLMTPAEFREAYL